MYEIFGLKFFSGSIIEVTDRVAAWVRSNKHTYICVTGAHGVVETSRTPAVLLAHREAGLVVPDGMPLVWIGRIMGFRNTERIYGPDLFFALCRRAQEEKWRVFFYGCTTRVLTALSQKLRDRFPKLIIAGSYAPPFRALTKKESREIVQIINTSRAQIVFVGLSTPKQELWMEAHHKKLRANVLLGVGAAFDFIAGTKKQAPLWMRRAGLEWLFRFFQEPRRLWYRSVVLNVVFIGIALKTIIDACSRKKITPILFSFITVTEVIAIIILGRYIQTRGAGRNVLGSAAIIPMSKASLSFPDSNKYSYFYELSEGVIATESAAWLPHEVPHQYNLDGLNDLSNYEIIKPSATFRIITLGDSFTFGMWVSTSENYSEKLEGMLNTKLTCPGIDHFEVLNMGVPGYDIAYSAERFRRRGVKYAPDLLLWYIRDDDFFIINEEFYPRIEFYKKELVATESAGRYGVAADDPNGPLNLTYKEVYSKNEHIDPAGRKEYTKVEREALHKFLSENSLPVTVFTFADTPEEYKSYIQEGILGLSNVSYFDKIENVETFHPYDYHPTSNGHTVIAESLYRYLTTTNKPLSGCIAK